MDSYAISETEVLEIDGGKVFSNGSIPSTFIYRVPVIKFFGYEK